MIPLKELEERVLRGIARLDCEYPGWYRRINMQSLDLQDCLNCVVGQLYGDFEEYVLTEARKKDLTVDTRIPGWICSIRAIVLADLAEYGFYLTGDDIIAYGAITYDGVDHDQNYENLTAIWKKHIQAKLEADSKSVSTKRPNRRRKSAIRTRLLQLGSRI